ncbi:Chloride channel protein F [Bienertia sinuspersici]
MIEEAARGPPHGILLAVVVVLVVSAPALLGDWEAITESFSDLISPLGLLLLPIILLLIIRFLSSDRGNFFHSIFTASGEPDSIHRASGSPLGVALVLAIVLFLVYYRISLFGGGDDDDD